MKYFHLIHIKADAENGPEHPFLGCEDRSQASNEEMDQMKHFRGLKND